MGHFSGMDEVEYGQGNPDKYLTPGRYLVRIGQVMMHLSRKKDWLMVVETEIIKVLQVDPTTANDPPQATKRAGQRPAITFNKRHDGFWNSVRKFFSQIFGCEGAQITEQIMDEIVHPERQPCRGFVVDILSTHTQTKAGGMFTLYDVRRLPFLVPELQNILTPEEMQLYFPGPMLQAQYAVDERLHTSGVRSREQVSQPVP